VCLKYEEDTRSPPKLVPCLHVEMQRPHAEILYSDPEICIVLCPYCKQKHKHGDLWGADDARSSHCRKGEYLLGNPISDAELFAAIKLRRYTVEQKRKYRAKLKEQAQEAS